MGKWTGRFWTLFDPTYAKKCVQLINDGSASSDSLHLQACEHQKGSLPLVCELAERELGAAQLLVLGTPPSRRFKALAARQRNGAPP
jgi:hypothetical protein